MTESTDAPDVDVGAPPDDRGDRPPWYRAAGFNIGLLALGIVLLAYGIVGLRSAGSIGSDESAVVAQLNELQSDEAALKSTIADIRDEISRTQAERQQAADAIAATTADLAVLETETALAEAQALGIQEQVWQIYATASEAADLESRLETAIGSAIASGNRRDVEGMNNRVEALRDTTLPGLESAIDGLSAAVAAARADLQGIGESVAIVETFDDTISGWETGPLTNGRAGLDDGAYVVGADDSGYLMWGISPYALSDATIEVVAEPVEGSNLGTFAYGVLCRAEDRGYLSGYLFGVTGEGDYIAGWYEPPGNWVDLLDRPDGDPVIERGLRANSFTVTCDGPELSFAVNGTELWSGSDDNLTTGRIAFGAYTYGDESVVVRFDDLRLTAPAQGGGN